MDSKQMMRWIDENFVIVMFAWPVLLVVFVALCVFKMTTDAAKKVMRG